MKFLNDPTSFLNDPDLFGQYSLVIEFLSSCFHLIPKIRTIFWAVSKIFCIKISKNSHFELYYWMILKLQKFTKIRHFNIFTCGFRQKFTNLSNFHFLNDFSQYLSSLFVKVQKTQFFCDFWMIRNFFGKTLGSVSYPYSKEPWGKKWRKSLEPFLRNFGN